jgi:hypothetical protein
MKPIRNSPVPIRTQARAFDAAGGRIAAPQAGQVVMRPSAVVPHDAFVQML